MSKLVRMPELAELRAFCVAVDLGSLGKAARLLRVSQPALSKRLKTLEALSGSQLLERSTRGVTPTAAGRRLYTGARRLLEEAEAVEALMEGLDSEQIPVRLAASPTMAEFVLPPLLVELESRHERHLAVELSIANSDGVRALVAQGAAELGIVAANGSAPAAGLSEADFCTDEVVVAVPETHPWAALEEIDPAEFVATPMIMRDPGANSRRIVNDRLEELGLTLAAPLAEIGSTVAAVDTAIREQAPVLLSSLALAAPLSKGLVVRRTAGIRFERHFVVVHCGEESLPAPARALAAHLLAAAPSPP